MQLKRVCIIQDICAKSEHQVEVIFRLCMLNKLSLLRNKKENPNKNFHKNSIKLSKMNYNLQRIYLKL